MKNIYKALADFQQEVPVIHKGTAGHNYSYADLPAIIEVINPLLKKHGLGFTQPINGSKIKTILFHVESGETIESETEMPTNFTFKDVETVKNGVPIIRTVIVGFEGMNQPQAIGSLISYFRRYAISSLLGLVTDKDTDGSDTTNNFKI